MNCRVSLLTGFWSTNIGNAFFQLGAQYLLHQALPHASIRMIADQPGYWNVNRGNPANALDHIAAIKMDYLVILGPYLRPEFPRIWARSLDKLQCKGVKLIVLSAGMMSYSANSFSQARSWLADYPPHVFITRDHPTYEELGHLATHAFDGVDIATFVSDIQPSQPVDLPPYVVFNFDQRPEPVVKPAAKTSRKPEIVRFDGQSWEFAFPRLDDFLARRSKAWLFARSLLPGTRHYPERLGDKLIVRTDHRMNPMLMHKSYRGPNSFVSDVPYTYLDIYANTEATFSNRVHACVATLSYGHPARLFSTSPRAYLLDRLGATTIRNELTVVDTQWLANEKLRMIDFLRQLLT